MGLMRLGVGLDLWAGGVGPFRLALDVLGAEPPQRLERVVRAFGHVLEGARRRRDVVECRLASLDAEVREPSERRALEAVRLGFRE